ncbi:hypothetical protein DL93DRAFT_2156137 [Clavulina sp. PMI_390]|nr:hypothetical protein DL93DRAFT_2156137 [Clavulina sp. PMI_390]
MTDFGRSHFFGGSPLNRLSWLRNSPVFLTLALESPRTKWVIFNDGKPLLTVPAPTSSATYSRTVSLPKPRTKPALTLLPTAAVLPLLGPAPYFAQGQNQGSVIPADLITTEHNGKGKFLESARIHGPTIVFLGTLESHDDSWLDRPASDYSKALETPESIIGDPYFALDVTGTDPEVLKDVLKQEIEGYGGVREEFGDALRVGLTLDPVEVAIFSEGRTMIDWNSRMKFCPSCGSKIYSLWGGWKLSCSSLLPWADNSGKKPCPTARGLHNVMHPRTDAVVAMAVLDETGEKILLGRNKRSRLPPGFYSTLSGFLEPSESFEEAVAREIWEESGIHVTDVRYHSCQPWPFPANLMIGCFAIADSSQKIRTDLDNELEDVRWFTRDEATHTSSRCSRVVIHMISNASGPGKKDPPSQGTSTREDTAQTHPNSKSDHSSSNKDRAVTLRVPGKQIIGGVLIEKWAHRQLDELGYAFALGRPQV